MTMRSLKELLGSLKPRGNTGSAAAHLITVHGKPCGDSRSDAVKVGKHVYHVVIYSNGATYVSTYVDGGAPLMDNSVYHGTYAQHPGLLDAIVMWAEHDNFAGLNLDEFVKKVLSGN